MPADPNRVRDVFLAAVELRPEQRPGYLTDACGDDDDLRAEVDRLLVAHAEPDRILEPPASAPRDAGTVDLPDGDSATGTFGPDAHRPKSMATGEYGPDGAAGTFGDTPGGPERSPAATLGTVIAGRYTLVEVIRG